jgi:hypothetical protein
MRLPVIPRCWAYRASRQKLPRIPGPVEGPMDSEPPAARVLGGGWRVRRGLGEGGLSEKTSIPSVTEIPVKRPKTGAGAFRCRTQYLLGRGLRSRPHDRPTTINEAQRPGQRPG